MARNGTPILAVLVDADNSSPKWAEAIFEEIASLGEASVRRIYGDFSRQQMSGWQERLPGLALVPHHQPANTVGKNSSDIALVIDAMDLLHSGRFDGFVLVSSDSDFTRLASRIREQGLDVYGIGQQKTPEAFRKACKRFIFVENLIREPEPREAPRAATNATAAVPMINAAMQALDPEGEWFQLGLIGQTIQATHPDFDSRSFGCSKLSDLVEKAGRYELRRNGAQVEVRRRD
ncbi:NYN domain-containing protein [Pararhodobacter zhoushanensis]|uniref:NYN domain-containing protein n=1 Tax=Pararhodobacter zhoushanensis TaxID=2479545 RepID=A0ABT3H102_9RHOB|nr:NYN domain-containing protein [Pararhodobacter zhoushanensis]MCW1933373.1 NYN domain-containing protein [Pararhodobacter zhoushanensis]